MKISIYFICLALLLSCGAFREIKEKDSIGRVTRVAYYDGSKLQHLEEVVYVGNTFNPSEIIYYQMYDSELRPFKREIYEYTQNNLISISVIKYENEKKIRIGHISFTYTDMNRINSVEYYAYSTGVGLYMIGLDQHNYENKNLSFRRIIRYQFNPETERTMQKAQYQIYYSNGDSRSMRYGVIDSEFRTFIEKTENDPEYILEKIKSLENFFLMETLGRENILK